MRIVSLWTCDVMCYSKVDMYSAICSARGRGCQENSSALYDAMIRTIIMSSRRNSIEIVINVIIEYHRQLRTAVTERERERERWYEEQTR